MRTSWWYDVIIGVVSGLVIGVVIGILLLAIAHADPVSPKRGLGVTLQPDPVPDSLHTPSLKTQAAPTLTKKQLKQAQKQQQQVQQQQQEEQNQKSATPDPQNFKKNKHQDNGQN